MEKHGRRNVHVHSAEHVVQKHYVGSGLAKECPRQGYSRLPRLLNEARGVTRGGELGIATETFTESSLQYPPVAAKIEQGIQAGNSPYHISAHSCVGGLGFRSQGVGFIVQASETL